ncbi:MAG: hypothetical protein SNH01_08570, partial [Rikenellaceae bacterium]
CLSRTGSGVRVPYAPQTSEAIHRKALKINDFRGFFIFVILAKSHVLEHHSRAYSWEQNLPTEKSHDLGFISLNLRILHTLVLLIFSFIYSPKN